MTFSLRRLLIGSTKKHLLLGRYRRRLANSRKYRRAGNVLGWVLFGLSAVLYLFTMYPTVSFWDCGEFISASSRLQVCHQPGSPLYQVVGALFSAFSFGNLKLVAILVNSVSAVASALSIMILFHIFLYLFNKYSEKYVGNLTAAFMASAIFALTDSFWTSSTEAEVYTLSFLFTVLCIRTVLLWDEKPKEKYIMLLCLLSGLSFCVHPSTLLVLPALVLIIYFHYKRISIKTLIFVALISVACLLVFMNILPLTLTIISFKPGLTVTALLLLFAGLILFSVKKNKPLLYNIVFGLLLFYVGCSPYLVTSIRGAEPLPGNEYGVSSSRELKDYISRSAYIKAPLFYGPYYTALPPKDFEVKDGHLSPVFDKELCTFFPRMWNYSNPSNEDGYISWTGQPSKLVLIDGQEREKPNYWQNLDFFVSYQMYYMYMRYFLWNFSGKTNDMQGYGDLSNGQWKTGYRHVDKVLGVKEGKIPSMYKNKGDNRYFAIPLILCVFGIFYHIGKDSKRFLFVLTIFIMYSLAIVVFLNNAAYEPRERDYVFLPSFMAISIWIGIGMLGFSQIIANIIRVKKPRYVLPIFLIVPVWMAAQNFDDHNHRHQYTAYNFAVSMLNSCERDAILFVDGDNDTYPLWYCQNVEHIREDVRVINRELLNNPYTIDQLQRPMPGNRAVKLMMRNCNYKGGNMEEIRLQPSFDTVELASALRSLYMSKDRGDRFAPYIKTLNNNRFKVKRDGKLMVLNMDQSVLTKGDIVILDILASNPDRPIYFSSWSNDNFLSLDDYLSLEGFAYRVNPRRVGSENGETFGFGVGTIDEDKMYENIMHGFSFRNFDKKIYYNETERGFVAFYAQNIAALSYKLLQQGRDDKALSLIDRFIESTPPEIHNYSLSLADMAMVCSMAGKDEQALRMMERSLKEFKKYMDNYEQGTIRFQAQQRLEAEKKMVFYMNLCLMAEDWGEENLRIRLSEYFFSVVRPYMEITYRQKKIMTLDDSYYDEEIERMNELIAQIRDFANHYEEELPEENNN